MGLSQCFSIFLPGTLVPKLVDGYFLCGIISLNQAPLFTSRNGFMSIRQNEKLFTKMYKSILDDHTHYAEFSHKVAREV